MTNAPRITGVLLAAALLVTAASAVPPTSGGSKPDVLVILTDQWSPRYTSWDNPQVRTPQLDKIAREGMIFDACYTCSPVCMPARVSLLTGLYPHNQGHGIWGNAGEYCVPAESATMYRDIKAAGYTTAHIGKTHWTGGTSWKGQFKTLEEFYAALGLDYVLDVSGPPDSPESHDPYSRYLKGKGLLEAVGNDEHDRYVNWEFEPRASVVKPEDYHDSFVTGDAVRYIAAHPKDKPMCVVVSLHSPHPPLDAPGQFATMYDPATLDLPANVPDKFQREGRTIDHAALRLILANYLGKMSLVDWNVGRLVEAMKERGTWDQTLVLFTADHGEMMGSHGYFTKGRFWEESGRVPLVVRWPGHVKVGRSPAPVQMFDVYPTIVEAIGGTLSPGRFAMSVLPIATGKVQSIRPVAISEIGKGPPLNLMARDARYKWWAEGTAEHLYDLRADPMEMHDLAGLPEYHEALDKMRTSVLTHLRSTQVNLAEGYIPKVQRLRAEAEGVTPTKKVPKKKKQPQP